MADIDVLRVNVVDGRIQSLDVRFKNAVARTVNRETAVTWAREGHSLIPIAGHGHDVSHGPVISLVESGDDVFLRSDTRALAADAVTFPGAH